MLDKALFEKLRAEYVASDAAREECILASRIIIKLSKQIIYGLHRGEDVTSLLADITSKVASLSTDRVSLASAARQEFVEAVCYSAFLTQKSLPLPADLGVSSEEYLLGLCDLSGELVRHAVQAAINNDKAVVQKVRNFVADLYGEFLHFNFRNSELRKKSDAIRWNLQKLEDLLLQLR